MTSLIDLGNDAVKKAVAYSKSYHKMKGDEAKKSGVSGTENYGTLCDLGVPNSLKSRQVVYNTAVALSKRGTEIAADFKLLPETEKMCKNTSPNFQKSVKNLNKQMIDLRNKYIPGSVETMLKLDIAVSDQNWTLGKMQFGRRNVAGEVNREDKTGSTASMLNSIKKIYGEITAENVPSELFGFDKAGIMRAAKMMKSRDLDLDRFGEIYNLSDSDVNNILDAIDERGLKNVYDADYKRFTPGGNQTIVINNAKFHINEMSVDYLFVLLEWFRISDLDPKKYGAIFAGLNSCAINAISDARIMKWVKGKAEGFKNPKNANDDWEKLYKGLKDSDYVREELDNPYRVNNKLICNAISLWGSMPLIVTNKSVFGFNELFVTDSMKTGMSEHVKNVLDGLNPKSVKHMVHRGLYGNVFCNISTIGAKSSIA